MFIPIVHRRATPEEIRKKIRQQPLTAIRELLPDREILEACERHGHRFRERLYGPVLTVLHFLAQALQRDGSFAASWQRLWAPVATEFPDLLEKGDTSALTHARARLPREVLEDLAHRSCREWAGVTTERWRGFRLRALDCATVSMSAEAELSEHFGHHRARGVKTAYPLATFAALLDLPTSLMIDYRFGPFDPGEMTTIKPLLSHLEMGDLLLADRKFSGAPMIAKLQEAGIAFVMRKHQRLKPENLPVLKQLGKDDFLTKLRIFSEAKKNDPSLPITVPVRIFRATWKTPLGEKVTEWFVTSLENRHQFPKKTLANLYHRRWQHEISYREFKVTCHADVLRSKTVENVYKEMAAHVLAYQLVRQLIVLAAVKHKKKPTRLSFLQALRWVIEFSEVMTGMPPRFMPWAYQRLLAAIASTEVEVRPGRVEPRSVKRERKHFPRLRVSRDEWRWNRLNGGD